MIVKPLVGIVILNWNQPKLTLECLESVSRLDYSSDYLQVIVVDNGSTDGSVVAVRAECPEVQVIENHENLGYAGGNNVGIRWAIVQGCEYVWLLNNDLIVAQDSLGQLVQAAESQPKGGFFGPVIYIPDDDHTVLSAGGRFMDGWRTELIGIGKSNVDNPTENSVVGYLSGCALLASKHVLELIGLLDEDYYLYHEDVDWCFRAKCAGYDNYLVPDAKVWHPDTRKRDEFSTRVTYYGTRNSLLFIKKHGLGDIVLAKATLVFIRTLLAWTLKPKWRSRCNQRDAMWAGLVDFWQGNYGKGRND